MITNYAKYTAGSLALSRGGPEKFVFPLSLC